MDSTAWLMCSLLMFGIALGLVLVGASIQSAHADTHGNQTQAPGPTGPPINATQPPATDAERLDTLNENIQILENERTRLLDTIATKAAGVPYSQWASATKHMVGFNPPFAELEQLAFVDAALQDLRGERAELAAEMAAAAEQARADAAAATQAERERAAELEALAATAEHQAKWDAINANREVMQTWRPHVGILLDRQCLTMTEHMFETNCPTYEDLRMLDNSYWKFDAWYVDADGQDRRDSSPTFEYHPRLYYDTLPIVDKRRDLLDGSNHTHQPTLHTIIDPGRFEVEHHPTIIITHNLPAYLGELYESRWDGEARTQQVFHGVYISKDCREALVGANVWERVLHHVIYELRTRCASTAPPDPGPNLDDNLAQLEPVATLKTPIEQLHSTVHTLPSYDKPSFSPELERQREMERLVETCHTGWRVC